MAARQKTQEQIAGEVGLSVKTLARIYAVELAAGRELIRQAVFETQLRQATEKGSTSAARFVREELERLDLQEGVYRNPRERRSQPKPGLKQQRQEAAASVARHLAPGAPPAKLQ